MTSIKVETKLAGVCSKDTGGRYGMTGALVTPNGAESCYLTCTNGRIATVVRCPIEAGSGALEGASIIDASILPNRKAGGTLSLANGSWLELKSAKKAEAREAIGFPPVAGVFPTIDNGFGYGLALTINAELLWQVARAIGRDGSGGGVGSVVTLFIDAKSGTSKKAIAVFGSRDRIGLLMPCVQGDEDRAHFVDLVSEYGKAAVKL